MIKALIVDDEQHCIDRVVKLLSDFDSKIEIVGTCNTVKDALDTAKKLQPDLVFLDIEIHNETGFDFLEQLGIYDFNVIFTTAFDNYAIKAFKYSASDYLLKPIDKDDFIDAIHRLHHRLHQNDAEVQIKTLLSNLNKEDKKKTLRIPTSNGFKILEIENIIHCEADTSYTHIHTKTEKVLVSKPIKFYEELLKDANFFRVHNSHLVNVDHVVKYTKGKGGYVTMSNNDSISVSSRRRDDFLELFD